jgi:hypothetical protein
VAGIRQQSNLSGFFNSIGHLALVLGAGAEYPPGDNLALIGNKMAQGFDFLVVYNLAFIAAKTTGFPPAEGLFSSLLLLLLLLHNLYPLGECLIRKKIGGK